MWHPCNSCVLRVYICSRFKYYLSSLATTLRWFFPSFLQGWFASYFGKNVFFDIIVRNNCVYILKCFFMLYLLHMFNKMLVYWSCSESLILYFCFLFRKDYIYFRMKTSKKNKGNNKITELRTILQRESQNS
jgi:hypothetical protein